jgi:hypothetical protein
LEELLGSWGAPNMTHVLIFRMFYAAVSANRILEGEMFRMTLSKPKNGNAQHLRVVSVVPLRSGFQPAIESLRELYGKRVGC